MTRGDDGDANRHGDADDRDGYEKGNSDDGGD